jgi:putative oxidoreductase
MLMNLYRRYVNVLNKLKDFPLLFLRLILSYGFYEPAKNKWADINAIAEWFQGMGIFAPKLNAYLAATTEMAGVFMLALGIGTRFISFLLIVTMLVAIKTVHWEHGFASHENGYEIPLYYILMLLTLMCFGSGKISLDNYIKKYVNR